MDELIQHFSFEHVHKSGARFDPEKAKWFNAQWLHRKPLNDLAASLKNQVEKKGWMNPAFNDHYFLKAAELLRPRVQFEHEMADTGKYLFGKPEAYDEKVMSKKWKEPLRSFFQSLADEKFAALDSFTDVEVELAFKSFTEQHQLKTGDVMPLLRVFLTGSGSGVDLFPMMELLGKTKVIERIKTALNKI